MVCRHLRGGHRRAPGELLLARHAQRPAADAERAAPLHRNQAGARLQRAHARQGGHRCHPQGGGRPEPRLAIRRDDCGSPDRSRSPTRSTPPLKEGAFVNTAGTILIVLTILWLALRSWQHHPRGLRQPAVGLSITVAIGLGIGRRAQPDLGRLRRSVHRPRRRFRHPVQRALSCRAARRRRPASGAAEHGALCGRAADARRRRDRRRLPVVPADRLQGRVRARPARRPRHDRRLPHQHHR